MVRMNVFIGKNNSFELIYEQKTHIKLCIEL
jgi:hypothetical protein